MGDVLINPAFAARTLNTLSLISCKLKISDRDDPSATLDARQNGTLILHIAAFSAETKV
jgi:hypothetical protein